MQALAKAMVPNYSVYSPAWIPYYQHMYNQLPMTLLTSSLNYVPIKLLPLIILHICQLEST